MERNGAHTVNQGNARTIRAPFADTFEITLKELSTSDLEAFLDNLGSKLVHTVFGSIAENVIDSTATVSRCCVFADVLDTPITKLTVGNNVNAGEDFVDARTLKWLVNRS